MKTCAQKDYGCLMPKAHRDDPLSSFIAGEEIEATGIAQSHREKCLAVVQARPGLTAGEIGARLGLTNAQAGRRLSELADMPYPLLVRGPCRKCSVNQRLLQTWWLKTKEKIVFVQKILSINQKAQTKTATMMLNKKGHIIAQDMLF